MYFYFYDRFTQEKKYESVLMHIETRLIELGINGRIEKLTALKNAKEVISRAIKQGAHTIVAVGDDATFTTVLSLAAPHNVTVGFIPIVDQSHFAKLLGIPKAEEACLVLSQRLHQTVDLARIGESYFFGSLQANAPALLTIQCDDTYSLSTKTPHVLFVRNLRAQSHNSKQGLFSGLDDGKVEVVVSPADQKKYSLQKKGAQNQSVLSCTTLNVQSTPTITLTVDGLFTHSTPCTIHVIAKAVDLIVGRQRLLQTDISPANT